jgi:hypothetical protein
LKKFKINLMIWKIGWKMLYTMKILYLGQI